MDKKEFNLYEGIFIGLAITCCIPIMFVGYVLLFPDRFISGIRQACEEHGYDS